MIQWGEDRRRAATHRGRNAAGPGELAQGVSRLAVRAARRQVHASCKTTQERELRARVSGDAKLAQQTGTAWDDIAKAQARYREIYDRYAYLESGTGFNSKLFGYARQLVRGAAERAKPNEQRLREYADSNLPKISAGLLAATPIYPEFETADVLVLARQDARDARPGRRRSCAAC